MHPLPATEADAVHHREHDRREEIEPLFPLDEIWSAEFHPSYAVEPGDQRFLMIRRTPGTSELVLVRNFLRQVLEGG